MPSFSLSALNSLPVTHVLPCRRGRPTQAPLMGGKHARRGLARGRLAACLPSHQAERQAQALDHRGLRKPISRCVRSCNQQFGLQLWQVNRRASEIQLGQPCGLGQVMG